MTSSQNRVPFLNFLMEHLALWSWIPGAIREGIQGRTGKKIPLQWHIINARLKGQTDAFKIYQRSSVPDKFLRNRNTEWSTITPLIHGDRFQDPSVDAWDLRELPILYILCAFLYLHTYLWWSLNNTLGTLIINNYKIEYNKRYANVFSRFLNTLLFCNHPSSCDEMRY